MKGVHPPYDFFRAACESFNINSHSLIIGDQNAEEGTTRAETRETLAGRLKEFRHSLLMPKFKFSQFMNASSEALEQIEAGQIQPLYLHLFYLHHNLGVDIEWLLFGEERKATSLNRIDTSHIPKSFYSTSPITDYEPPKRFLKVSRPAKSPPRRAQKKSDFERNANPRARRLKQYDVINSFRQFGRVVDWAKAENVSRRTILNRIEFLGLDHRLLESKYYPAIKRKREQIRAAEAKSKQDRKRRLKLYSVILAFKTYGNTRAWAEAEQVTKQAVSARIRSAGLDAETLRRKYDPTYRLNPEHREARRNQLEQVEIERAAQARRAKRLALYHVVDSYKRFQSLNGWAESEGVSPTTIRRRVARVGLTLFRLRSKYGPFDDSQRPKKPRKPPSFRTSSAWSATDVAELLSLRADGYSAGQISKITGRSRSAVLGKLHRLKLAS